MDDATIGAFANLATATALATMLKMQLWDKLDTRWMMPPLEHWQIWQQQQQQRLTVAAW
jgi:hypothetical protein